MIPVKKTPSKVPAPPMEAMGGPEPRDLAEVQQDLARLREIGVHRAEGVVAPHVQPVVVLLDERSDRVEQPVMTLHGNFDSIDYLQNIRYRIGFGVIYMVNHWPIKRD